MNRISKWQNDNKKNVLPIDTYYTVKKKRNLILTQLFTNRMLFYSITKHTVGRYTRQWKNALGNTLGTLYWLIFPRALWFLHSNFVCHFLWFWPLCGFCAAPLMARCFVWLIRLKTANYLGFSCEYIITLRVCE